MDNHRIAIILGEIADLLEIGDDNPFRIRSYRNAALNVESCAENLTARILEGREIREIPGIGEGIAGKIREIVQEGDCQEHRQLLQKMPAGLLDFLKIPGIGPKKAGLFFRELALASVEELESAARQGRLRSLPGISQKTEEKILQGIEGFKKTAGRTLWSEAESVVLEIESHLKSLPQVRRLEVAGSFRRRRETVGDIDFLLIGRPAEAIFKAMTDFRGVKEVLARGETKCSIRLQQGLQVDLRTLPAESYGAAWQYFTGSQAHNIALRDRAKRLGYKVNEYGVFSLSDEKIVAGETEEEVYRRLGLSWIPPEIRENRGELELAAQGIVPDLIEQKDIRGDLHLHTHASDGQFSLEEAIFHAEALGYEYLAVTDHSISLSVARGLDAKRLQLQMKQIDDWNRKKGVSHRVHLLKGCEVDIKADGSLDLPEELLLQLDIVIAAVHSHMNMPAEEMTERIVRAISRPCVHILAHPTGRILLQREPFAMDMEKILETAARHGVAMELNAYPARLDLNDIHCRSAAERGVGIAINTDSHSPKHLAFMRNGIFQARRGHLQKDQVLNTRTLADLLTVLDRRKKRLR